MQDGALVEAIQANIGQLPGYGYRRVWALMRRDRERRQEPPINVKRCVTTACCWSAAGGLKCPYACHDGQVAVLSSNERWCSDGFEFRCEVGSPCE